jgi:methylglyoxal synthase
MYQLTRPEVTAHLAERRDFKAFCSQAFPGSSSKILHLFSMRGNLAGSRADTKRIAPVAHDNKKADLIEWARFNRDTLAAHHLCATGTTGSIIENELKLEIVKLQSGPLAGDKQIGAMISRGELDLLIFFCDALETQPHDPDVKALLRRTVVWNIPVACNRSTADFMIASPLMSQRYERLVPDH